jgi:voltage-gated potassium channel
MKKISLPLIPYDSKFRISWDLLMVVVVFFSAILIPYRMVSGKDPLDLIYWIITVFFCIDILINFNTQTRFKLKLLSDRKSVARHYITHWFIIDFLAAFPFPAFAFFLMGEKVIGTALFKVLLLLRLLRLLKLVRITETFKELQEIANLPPAFMRLSIFLFWFALLAHFMSLGWILIGAAERLPDFMDTYIRSLYWCITTIATIGYGDYYPNHGSNLQIIYTIIVQLLGVGMYSYIIGNVATLIANIDTARSDFLNRMEQMKNFLHLKKIPKKIQNRIKDYYNYIWETRRNISNSDLLTELPHTLRMEVSLFLNRDILQKVPLFRDESEVFIHEVIELLKPLVYLPGDLIIRQGEYGDCMYFLSSGEVEILVNGSPITVLHSGSPFGETALIQGERRNATVKAITYCDLFKLSKSDFDTLRTKYPEFDSKIKRLMHQRLETLNRK